MPIVPYSAVGYVAGAAQVPLWRFAWTTVVGSVPLCAAVVYLGHRLDSLSPTDPGVLVAVGAFLLLLVGGRMLTQRVRDGASPHRLGGVLRRLLFLASSIVFLDTVFFAAIVPLLPTYAAEFDLSKTGAGILAAAYPAGTFLGALPGGWLTARIGVRPTVVRRPLDADRVLARVRLREQHRRPRPRPLRPGARRRRVVGGRGRLAGRRGAARAPR